MAGSARDREDQILKLCVLVGGEEVGAALDEREANVFRLAAILVEPRRPVEAGRLRSASKRWFAAHSTQPLAVEEVVQRGWIRGLPWFKDELARRLAPPPPDRCM